jgi:bifunctional non-homologous end joining protein LigD
MNPGPIAFMRLHQVDDPEDVTEMHDPADIVVQEKYDGWKILAVRDRSGVSLYTRHGNDASENFPDLEDELSYLPVGTAVLGEIVGFDREGKQRLALVQSIAGSGPGEAAQKTESLLEEGGRLAYYVYDMLWDGGQDIMSEPWVYRDSRLREAVEDGDLVKLVVSYPWSEHKRVIQQSLAAGGEGLVVKPRDSLYVHGGPGEDEPHGEWIKYKKSYTEDVILTAYELGDPDPRGFRKASFEAVQVKDGERVRVGNLTSVSHEVQQQLMDMVDAEEDPVVEVRYQERHPKTGLMRHMRFVRLRPDKPATSATLREEWSMRHRRSIDCENPRGFGQKNFCKGVEIRGHRRGPGRE